MCMRVCVNVMRGGEHVCEKRRKIAIRHLRCSLFCFSFIEFLACRALKTWDNKHSLFSRQKNLRKENWPKQYSLLQNNLWNEKWTKTVSCAYGHIFLLIKRKKQVIEILDPMDPRLNILVNIPERADKNVNPSCYLCEDKGSTCT